MFGATLKEKIGNIFHSHKTESQEDQIKIQEPISSFEEEFDISPVSILYVNGRWEIEKLNMSAAHTFGTQTGSLEGQPFLALIDTQSAQSFVDQIHKALATGEKQTAELKFRKVHGQIFPAKCEMIPIFDEHGKLQHFRTVVSDMTPEMNSTDLIH